MTTTPTSDETPSAFTDKKYGAQRTEAAVWAGASALITDRRGRVLVERVSYRDTRLLPGAVDKGESPAHAASRELREELGVTMALDRGLAVDWVSAAGANARPAMRFPGEVLHVFDGGTWGDEQIAAIRPREGEIEAVDFVEPARLPELMSPDNARRALSALRARINAAGPALLEDGLPIAPTVLDQAGVLRTVRARHHFPFHTGPAPEDLPVHQVWGWLFAPDGRVLVLLEPDTGAACLPGGTPELQDRGDPLLNCAGRPARRPQPRSGSRCSSGTFPPSTERAPVCGTPPSSPAWGLRLLIRPPAASTSAPCPHLNRLWSSSTGAGRPPTSSSPSTRPAPGSTSPKP
ncbi:NUDIX domain-containing protein [Streptomyces sp. NWU339]|uniref:NUDIX domain-containing protein n=1 Tax=Streptomyces sp. NWU339 TaxID=2185284 RepID=UPI00215AACC4|nr:NUDIX domain-containing protein [Streptomyces sp. NWU339]